MKADTTFVGPIVRDARGYALLNERTGRVLASVIEPAFDSERRRRGLLGRDSLERGRAMIIAPSNSIHMFFMRFPIDVAFVDRRGTVLQVRHSLQPWRLAIALRAFAAVEMPSGTLAETDTRAGDRLLVAPQP